jgi:5-methylcytosine-specific restriction protein A
LPAGSRFTGQGYRYLETDDTADTVQFCLAGSGDTYGPEIALYDRSEIGGSLDTFEGHRRRTTSSTYERNERARKACIDRYGLACQVCGIDFGERYGPHGRGFIEVHHLRPIAGAAADGPYRLDPERDLRPVCPNCHRMIHYGNGLLTIEAARELLR